MTDAAPVSPGLLALATFARAGAALLACGIAFWPLRYRPLRPVALALVVAVLGELARDLFALVLDGAPVPVTGPARIVDALDVALVVAGLLAAPAAVWQTFTGKGGLQFVAGGVALWLLLVVPYPFAPWTRGEGQALVLASVAHIAGAFAALAFVLWLLLRRTPRIEHGAALSLLLAHAGLLVGPYRLASVSAVYQDHERWAVTLFGTAFVMIVFGEVSWIAKRFSRAS